jgi:hypothetical protein
MKRLSFQELGQLYAYLSISSIPLDERVGALDAVHRKDIIWVCKNLLFNQQFDKHLRQVHKRNQGRAGGKSKPLQVVIDDAAALRKDKGWSKRRAAKRACKNHGITTPSTPDYIAKQI